MAGKEMPCAGEEPLRPLQPLQKIGNKKIKAEQAGCLQSFRQASRMFDMFGAYTAPPG